MWDGRFGTVGIARRVDEEAEAGFGKVPRPEAGTAAVGRRKWAGTGFGKVHRPLAARAAAVGLAWAARTEAPARPAQKALRFRTGDRTEHPLKWSFRNECTAWAACLSDLCAESNNPLGPSFKFTMISGAHPHESHRYDPRKEPDVHTQHVRLFALGYRDGTGVSAC